MEITFQASDLWGILPVLILMVFASVAALMEVFAKADTSRSFIAGFSVVGCVLALATSYWQWKGIDGAFQVPLFGKMLVMDAFSTFFNMIFIVGAMLASLLGARYLREHNADFGEYYALVLFSAAGMGLMVQSRDLIVLFISLEIMSMAIYVLSGFVRKNRRGAEAALKYFLMGSVASAVLLYGVALLYGGTGSTDLVAMREAFDADKALGDSTIVKLGMVFLIGGMAFKVALAPFHLWTPDVYDGAPSPVTAFMAAGVKAAGLRGPHPPVHRDLRLRRPGVRERGQGLGRPLLRPGRGHHVRRQPGRHPAGQREAHAGLLQHRPRRLPAGGHHRRRLRRPLQPGHGRHRHRRQRRGALLPADLRLLHLPRPRGHQPLRQGR
jgi:NADH:ubiquinone oxidoreductase subunit K